MPSEDLSLRLSRLHCVSDEAYTVRTSPSLRSGLGLPLRAEVIEQVLVKVNGEILTKTDVEQLQVTALRASNPNVSPSDLRTTKRCARCWTR